MNPSREVEAKMRTVIEEDRKRYSDKEPAYLHRSPQEEPAPPYRSQAERTRVQQGWLLMLINLSTLGIVIYQSFIR